MHAEERLGCHGLYVRCCPCCISPPTSCLQKRLLEQWPTAFVVKIWLWLRRSWGPCSSTVQPFVGHWICQLTRRRLCSLSIRRRRSSHSRVLHASRANPSRGTLRSPTSNRQRAQA